MSRTTSGSRPVRALVTLSILLTLIFGGIFATAKWGEGEWTPKLALDLEGGTQIVLTPRSDTGEEVTTEAINEAISIIRQRVDAAGVSEAEITSQGGQNIVVALAGEPDQATLDLVRESAQMQFRPVLIESAPNPIDEDELEGDIDEDDLDLEGLEGEDVDIDDLLDSDDSDSDDGEDSDSAEDADGDESDSEDAEADDDEDSSSDDEAEAEDAEDPEDPSDLAWVTDDVLDEFYDLDCTADESLIGGEKGDPEKPLVTCAESGDAKYILGPVELHGDEIKTSDAGLKVTSTGATTNEWVVDIEFKPTGKEQFADISRRLVELEPPRNQFGIMLDDLVISAPRMNQVITDGKAQITGDFTRETAQTMSSQLRFGALPLSFEVQSEEQISATLGTEQLEKGLIAGLIGLLLVVAYSFYQYRGLGIVTIASLFIAGALTYGSLVLLGSLQGYRLSLPGVAGVIISIGITADSFIVYFERVRDEVREGRSLVAAVSHGWDRAKRTILVSDAVSFMAAVVLYFLAVGGVRGFAFTLGLTTLIDLVVVYLFTHPMLTLLVQTRFFGGGHKLSGLDPVHLGSTVAAARGRGLEAAAQKRSRGKGKSELTSPLASDGESLRSSGRMTIAERRAAEAAAEESNHDEGEES